MTGIRSIEKDSRLRQCILENDPRPMLEAQSDESIDPAARWLEVSGQDKIRNFCDAAVAWWRGSCTWRSIWRGCVRCRWISELRYRYRAAERYDAAGDTVLQGAFSRAARPHQRSP